ncbi:mediator of RNA polymerase II transcription subunit 10 [Delphinella strobiligena]|nr:mediator of RNA polymerase II transcription subunit 10 [Delphinella strobiligena]
MAAITANASLDEVDEQLKNIINNLYMLIVQSYDYHGPNTAQAMTAEIKLLIQNLLSLVQTSRRLPIGLPPEIIDYVERSRNPDIYTREFVELVQRLNQQLKGRSLAYADFRDTLAKEMITAFPDCQEEIKKTVESTGGKIQS